MSMQERYEPQALESKWQSRWEEAGIFQAGQREGAPRKYVLEMLPYPSGKMHMGHVRNYLIGDVLARYYRMRGFDVLHPMGWDAFGLPAENAAIKEGVHPAVRTAENIIQFKAEMKTLGYAYDWTREVNTSDPSYYRWNQWFFLKMRERGLAYRRTSRVNWCTGCLTVIANEQVKDGVCERCEKPVVDRDMPQWAFRITRDSQALLDNLDTLVQWPERIVKAQREWIGRSDGVEAEFVIDGVENASLRVFTTRVDTIYGCTYVVLAPEHALTSRITTPGQQEAVEAFVAKMARQGMEQRTGPDAPKEGVFTGAYAVHPFTGEKVPVWIANFVLADYGTGAVMSVPAHDDRDFAFARAYGLPLRQAIAPASGDELGPVDQWEEAYTDDGVLVDSGPYSGRISERARADMGEWLTEKGLGNTAITYRQKDWGFSRQRYWGTPIPIVYCEKCDPQGEGIAVPYDQLPVTLPEIDVQAVLTGKGEPPLAKISDWVNTTCPKCQGPARREAETMDTFVDSTWYYARYLTPNEDQAPFDPEAARAWLPVDVYVGGPEHATMHLLYFRFWSRVMKELGLSPVDEPVERLITQGIVNGPDGRKMSKRWGNSVAPATIVNRYGADTARAYVLFAGPPDRDFDWSDDQVEGSYRFLKRVWAYAYQHHAATRDAVHDGPFEGKALEIRRATHKCIKRVGESIERLSFNTAVAFVMETLNTLQSLGAPESLAEKAAVREAVQMLCTVLTPIVPHLSDEIAAAYGAENFTVTRDWPAFDPALVVDDVITYAVQVNGKVRAEVKVALDATAEQVRAAAEAEDKIRAALTDKTVRKFVFVPRRLVNFVVG